METPLLINPVNSQSIPSLSDKTHHLHIEDDIILYYAYYRYILYIYTHYIVKIIS